ncbi:MAG: adenylate/guanylate cyclase domain-containing protein [Azospirillaceae bacterium]
MTTRPRRLWMPAEGHWLAEERATRPLALADAMFRGLVAAGIPLLRANIALTTLHPEIVGFSYRWTRETDETVRIDGRRERVDQGLYATSPYKLIFEDGIAGIRRRLDRPEIADDLGILADMRAMGATDYVAMAASAGLIGGVVGTWTTDRPGGFTTAELVLIERELQATTRTLENLNLRDIAVRLLDTYVGPRAGARILTGEIARGSGETLEAVIWLADMVGFTRLSDTLPRDRLIAVLNDFYDRVGGPVTAHGGEVIKLIGDGILAIFPTDIPGGAAAAVAAAVAATDAALAALNGVARREADRGETNSGDADLADADGLDARFVLHLGPVSFGNVGLAQRLDFTVIGPAVNLTSRLERLAAETGERVLLSEPVARYLPDRAEPIGAHHLRGLPEAQAVYRLGSGA